MNNVRRGGKRKKESCKGQKQVNSKGSSGNTWGGGWGLGGCFFFGVGGGGVVPTPTQKETCHLKAIQKTIGPTLGEGEAGLTLM